MDLKSICIGDPHIKITNTEEIDECVKKILEIVNKYELDFIVVLGDLLHDHEKLHTIALNKAVNFVKKLSEKVLTFVLVGNHDMINHDQFLTKNHWMNSMKGWNNIRIVDYPTTYTTKGHKFVFVPFVAPGRFVEALDKLDEDWKDASCIFAHQEFRGFKMGAIISEQGDKWDKEYPNVISGHIHSRQLIDNVYYTGSVLQHAYGESEKNIIAHIKFKENPKTKEDKNYELEEIDLELPRKKIVYLNMEDLDTYELPKEMRDNIRLTIHRNSLMNLKLLRKQSKYKKLITHPKIKIIHKPTIQEDESDDEMEEVIPTEETFLNILKNLVKEENNLDLKSDFNYVFLNDEVLFI